MTPPHIEAAARAIDPQAFDDNATQLCSPQSAPRRRDQAIRIATLVWNLAIEEAAKVADAYAEENIMMAQDSIINDPLLSKLCGRNMEVTVTNADFDASESMIVDGTIHSSMFHAAQNIAAAIRALIPKEG